MTSFDIEKYRLQDGLSPTAKTEFQPTPDRVRRVKGRFIRGPLPLDQLIIAANQGGKCLSVLLVLLFVSGLKKTRSVQAPPKVRREFGVNRHSFYRAVNKLEESGLISVSRQCGRGALVTLLDRCAQIGVTNAPLE